MSAKSKTASKPSPLFARMLSAARKISEAQGVELPPEVETSQAACRAFLDQIMSRPAPPTRKMRALAIRLARENNLELGDALESFVNCRTFIRTHEKKLRVTTDEDEMLQVPQETYGGVPDLFDFELPEETLIDSHP